MPSLTDMNFERHYAELEKSKRELRRDHAHVRELLAALPRCSCGSVALYEFADGSYVCRSCCDAGDELASKRAFECKRVFEWERAATSLEQRVAAWEATDE